MSDARFLMFFAIVVVFSAAMHGWLGLRLIRPFELEGKALVGAWSLVGLSALAIPGTFLLLPTSGRPATDVLQWAGYLMMGLFSILLIGVIARDLLWASLWIADKALPFEALPEDPDRRRFLGQALNLALLGLAGGTAALGFFGTRRIAEVVPVRIPVKGLPEALDGFRIAQISDLHVGPTVRRPLLETLVERVNALKPDLVAVTGDLVDGSVRRLAPHVAPLKRLQARHGTWFVTGNHEYYSGVEAWCAHIRDRLGWRILNDEHEVVEHGGATVLVAGVTDLTAPSMHPTHVSDVGKAVEGAPETDLRLLLAHQPEAAPAARSHGFHLQLSGHTHGGQYFPFNLLVRLVKRWVVGLYREGDLYVYVNPGTTWWGPPMRLGSPQEITMLELFRA